MSGIWREPTATGPIPFQIMRQREARATKTETGISQSGSLHFRIKGDGRADAGEMNSDGDVTQHKW